MSPWQELIGRLSTPVPNWVERGAVRRFAQAIGDPHPDYVDEEAALAGRYGGLIAPPTFPVTFEYGSIEGLTLPSAGLIHGEQSFTYARPLRVGERLACAIELRDTYEKQGGRGLLTFLVFAREGRDEAGEMPFSAQAVIVVTEHVRRGMGL